MAHFCLLAATQSRDGVSAALHPFWNDDRDGPSQPHFVFIEDAHADMDETAGRRGFWRNPVGKWDGWIFGGNWDGLLDGENQRLAGETTQLAAAMPDMFSPIHAILCDGIWRDAEERKLRSHKKWREEVQAFVRNTPAAYWISVIDCHC